MSSTFSKVFGDPPETRTQIDRLEVYCLIHWTNGSYLAGRTRFELISLVSETSVLPITLSPNKKRSLANFEQFTKDLYWLIIWIYIFYRAGQSITILLLVYCLYSVLWRTNLWLGLTHTGQLICIEFILLFELNIVNIVLSPFFLVLF